MWSKKIRKRFTTLKNKYHYDKALADSKIEFVHRYCRHIKGDLAGQPFILDEFQQEEVIKPIFGLLKDNGKRLIREVYIQVPRKNGKTTLAAPIELILLGTDGEAGAEIINAAGDDGQADLLFSTTRAMVESGGLLEEGFKCFNSSITYNGRSIKRLTSKVSTKHGLNLHGGVIDEIHVLPNRGLYDVLRTSTGQRAQPLILSITTPGTDKNSICYHLFNRSVKVLTGVTEDDSFWCVLYDAPEKCDIMNEKYWRQANPLYDCSPYLREYLKGEAIKAQEDVSYENTFRQLHLGQWVQSEVKWIKDEIIVRQQREMNLKEYGDKECFMGLDLSSTEDLTAVSVLIPGKIVKLFIFYWIPEEKADWYEKKYNVPYRKWASEGHITLVEGNAIDYISDVEPKIKEIDDSLPVLSMGYDPSFGSIQIALRFNQEFGISVNKYRQGFSLHAGFDRLSSLLRSEKLELDDNPVTRWMFDNAMKIEDRDQRMTIKKPDGASEKKVDGIISAAMALMEMLSVEQPDAEAGSIDVW